MRRFLIAILSGGMVFGLTFGAAAMLGVNPAYVQAGTTEDLVCTEDDVTISNFGVELDTFNLSGFTIHDIPDACFAVESKLIVRLYDEGENDIGGGVGRAVDPLTSNSVRINLVGIDVRDLHEIRVAIQSTHGF